MLSLYLLATAVATAVGFLSTRRAVDGTMSVEVRTDADLFLSSANFSCAALNPANGATGGCRFGVYEQFAYVTAQLQALKASNASAYDEITNWRSQVQALQGRVAVLEALNVSQAAAIANLQARVDTINQTAFCFADSDCMAGRMCVLQKCMAETVFPQATFAGSYSACIYNPGNVWGSCSGSNCWHADTCVIGDYIQVDFGINPQRTVTRLVHKDLAHPYSLRVSNDLSNWVTLIATISPGIRTEVVPYASRGFYRYMRLIRLDSGAPNPWLDSMTLQGATWA